MPHPYLKALALLATLSVPRPVSAAPPSPETRAIALLAELQRATRSPAVSAAVAVGGRVVLSRALGTADVASGSPATTDTVFNIGSISKAVTAIAVEQLVEAGRVRLDDPIQKYVHKYASGGMLSTAEDLARLGAALNHDKLLGPAARAELLAPQLPVVRRFREDGPPAVERFQQGLLWRLVHRPPGAPEVTFVYECGTFNGFNACVLDYLRDDVVVAMTLNLEAGGYKPAEALAALFRAAGR